MPRKNILIIRILDHIIIIIIIITIIIVLVGDENSYPLLLSP